MARGHVHPDRDLSTPSNWLTRRRSNPRSVSQFHDHRVGREGWVPLEGLVSEPARYSSAIAPSALISTRRYLVRR